MIKKTPFPFLHLTILAAGMLITACSQHKNPKTKHQFEEKKQVEAPVLYKKPPSGFSDTHIIAGPAAVFFAPDSLQLEKIKAVTEKMDHESNVHDCFFQVKNARSVIKKYWPQVKIIEPAKVRFLLFVSTDKHTRLTDLDAINDMCGLLLFNGIKEAEIADMTNIDTALRQYFQE